VIRQLFTYGCPTRAPGDHRRLHSVTGTLLSSPLPDAVRKKREEESRKVASKYLSHAISCPFASRIWTVAETDGRIGLAKSDSSPLTYILSPHQIIDNDYRLPSYVSPSSPSDELAIPRTNGTDTSEDGPPLSDRPAAIIEPEFVVPPSTISMTANGRPNVQVDRQRGNVNGHEGWVETPKAEGPPPDGLYPVLAIDCEMVSSLLRTRSN
jgi:RNA exonuclease 1